MAKAATQAVIQERRDHVEQLMLAFVPPRVVAKQVSERYGCHKSTVFKDMSWVEKKWDSESTLLQNKDEWKRLKHQHIKSVQLAMAASIAKGQYNQFVRLSETYIKLMGFNKSSSEVKHVIQQQKEAASKMSEEDLAKIIAASGIELH
tara:strand:+ start:3788 stop:4231 length:444 start_codon:yes stop_codon:yes gene_type:complete